MPTDPSPLVVLGGSALAGGARFTPADLHVRRGRIASVGPPGDVRPDDAAVLDATGLLVAPGLVDVQCNGAFGIDLAAEPERVGELAALLPATGVTSWCPTLVTSPPDRFTRLRAAVAALRAAAPPGIAEPVGLHLEGPILHPDRRGAHPLALLRGVDEVDTAAWAAPAGVALVTLAPEQPGALALVAELRRRGVVVASGHTDATPAHLDDAVAAGVTAVTHIGNGMPPFHHRRPGPVGWALAHPTVVAGLIADGVHLHPLAVATFFRALGPHRTLLVSDTVAAAGTAAPGPAASLGDGTLAGATTFLDRCVRNLVAFTGCAPGVALRCASAVPAGLLGRRDRGRLAAGRRADLVLLSPGLDVVGTVVAGVPSAGLVERITRSTSSPAG